jgi:hypothetical protein
MADPATLALLLTEGINILIQKEIGDRTVDDILNLGALQQSLFNQNAAGLEKDAAFTEFQTAERASIFLDQAEKFRGEQIAKAGASGVTLNSFDPIFRETDENIAADYEALLTTGRFAAERTREAAALERRRGGIAAQAAVAQAKGAELQTEAGILTSIGRGIQFATRA